MGELPPQWRAETANLRAALEWAIQKANADLALGLATRTWFSQITEPERARWLDAALMLGEAIDPTLYAMALGDAAGAYYVLGDFDRAESLAQRSLDRFVRLDDERGQSRALRRLGLAASGRGDYDSARERYERGLQLAEAAGDKNDLYILQHFLGDLERYAGNLNRSRLLLEEALQLALDSDDPHAALIEQSLGDVLAAGEVAAERHYLRANLARPWRRRRTRRRLLSRRTRQRRRRTGRARARRPSLGSITGFPRCHGHRATAV